MKPARLVPEQALSPSTFEAWPGRPVTIDGFRGYVRETPASGFDAEPAVYVHGLGGSASNWTDLAGLLANRLHGYAIDLPGFGRSDPARRYGIAAAAARVARWIAYLGEGPVHLLGNSVGGTVAVRVAALHPELVRSLTLISPAMPFLNPRRSLQARALPLLAVPRAERLAARLLTRIEPEEMVRQVIAACYADPSRVTERRLAEAVEEIRLRYTLDHYPAAYLGTLRGLVLAFLRAYLPGANSLWRLARQVAAPTLVVGGRQDRLVDVRVAPRVAGVIPDSRLLMLDGVGHVAQMEEPYTVGRAVLALLDELRELGGSPGKVGEDTGRIRGI
jgi:pimeloyl-ACP methyl ester carboxylesterase